MRAPVTAAIITRDDPGLADAVASIRPFVEEVVVVGTAPRGSAPFATTLADRWDVCGADLTVNDEKGQIRNFSAARNHAFSLARQPWILWLDADDVVAGGAELAAIVRDLEALRKGRP